MFKIKQVVASVKGNASAFPLKYLYIRFIATFIAQVLFFCLYLYLCNHYLFYFRHTICFHFNLPLCFQNKPILQQFLCDLLMYLILKKVYFTLFNFFIIVYYFVLLLFYCVIVIFDETRLHMFPDPLQIRS